MFSSPRSDSLPPRLPLPAPAVVVEPVTPETAAAASTSGYPLLAIVGPTAAGKSALALAIAKRWNGEIVNYDAMQVYRGFDIGTGKLRTDEQDGIPHHLLDCVEPDQMFTAGEFARAASATLVSVCGRGRLPILVGGTGLYLRALLEGLFEGPKRSEVLRARLGSIADRHGREFLHRLLRRLDPPAAARIEPRDTQKIIRAVEVCLLAGQPLTALQARGRKALQGFQIVKVGLDPARRELNRRIDARVEHMFAAGLVDEARRLFDDRKNGDRAAGSGFGPFTSLGYPQAIAAARGEISDEEAILQTQAATRRYAKRQRTWFRHELGVTWFAGFGDDAALQEQIFEWLEKALPPLGASRRCPNSSPIAREPLHHEVQR